MKENKKYKIILIRHGQSEGNVDPSKYMTITDHNIKLTPKGMDQAIAVGKELKNIVKDVPLSVYVSPYRRTKETWEGIRKGLNRNNIELSFDPRLREQEHTMFKSNEERKKKFKEQQEFSKFFYRFVRGGESGADVFNRVSNVLLEMRVNHNFSEDKQDCLIVAHEIALRSILMKLLQLDVDAFDQMPHIQNCSAIVLETTDFKTATINAEFTIGNDEVIEFLG